jgi:hypothetical protein
MSRLDITSSLCEAETLSEPYKCRASLSSQGWDVFLYGQECAATAQGLRVRLANGTKTRLNLITFAGHKRQHDRAI